MSEIQTIVLSQTFPLGKFHATPWGQNPYSEVLGMAPKSVAPDPGSRRTLVSTEARN